VKFNALSIDQKATIAAIAAGFTACSRCSTSAAAFSGRRCPITSAARRLTTASPARDRAICVGSDIRRHGSKLLFVGAFCIILSMYGGGFATVPAYLADMFGTQFVGAIHGRLLTACRPRVSSARWW